MLNLVYRFLRNEKAGKQTNKIDSYFNLEHIFIVNYLYKNVNKYHYQ